MSRETNINVNVNSGKSISTISKLKEAFEGLKVAKDSVASDGKIKLAIDFKGADGANLDAMSKAIGRLGTGMKNVAQNSKVVADAGGMFNVTTNNVTNNSYKASKAVDGLGTSLENVGKQTVGGIMALESLRRASMQFINTYSQLTGSTFDVGIASQMNISQIEALNKSFLDLSTTVPSSANEMAKAVDALIRTGRGFDESRKIIEQVAILSTASGDSLKDTAQVVTKVMVSLNISANKVEDTLNSMHSTAIQTASDMGYLAEAFKNVAGTASVLVKQSGLSGDALDSYKQKVLDVTMASIGSMANLGLSASQSGTKIKQMFGKMTAGEKSARALFDTATKLGNITFENLGLTGGKKGQLFDFEALSNMTKKDLPMALETMSKMYIQGQLSTQTMQKMFTARHFMEISNLLIDINGNVDSFVNGIAKGINYADDFYKKMFDVNKQWEQLKNNMVASTGGEGQFMTSATTGILMEANKLLPKLSTNTKDTTSALVSLATTFGIASIGAGTFIKFLLPIASAGGLVGLAIGGIASLGLLIGKVFYDDAKQVADLNLNLSKTLLIEKQIEGQLKSNSSLHNKMTDIVDNEIQSQKGINYVLEDSSTVWGQILSKSKDFVDVMSALDEYKLITSDMLPDEFGNDINELKSNIEGTMLLSKQTIDSSLEYYVNKMKESISVVQNSDINEQDKQSAVGIYETKIDKAKLLFVEYEKLIQQGVKLTEIEDRIYEIGKGMQLKDFDIKEIIKSIPTDKIGENVVAMGEYYEELKRYNQELKESFKDINEQITANNKAINMAESYISRAKMDILEKTGEWKGAKGFEGVFKIFSEEKVRKVEAGIEAVNSKLTNLKELEASLEKEKINAPKDENVSKNLQDTKKQIMLLEKEHSNLLKTKQENYGLEKMTTDEVFKGINYNKKTLEISSRILELKETIDDLRVNSPEKVIPLQQAEEMLALEQKKLSIANQEIEEKKRKTDYQIKYNNYVKEDFSVQLEIAKLMKTQGAQQILIYEYKKKELEANRDIAKEDINTAKKKLSRQGIDATELTSSRQVQDILSSMNAQYGDVIQDKVIKDRIEAYKDLGKAIAKEENLTKKIDILPWKELNSTLESIPSTVENAYKSLGELGEFKGEFGFKTKLQEYIDRDLKNQVEQFNDSFRTGKDGVIINALGLDNLPEALEKAKNDLLLFEDKAREAMSKRAKGAELSPEEDAIVMALVKQQKETEDLVKLNDRLVDKKQLQLEIDLKILDTYVKMGDTLSKFGSAIGSQGLQDFGDIFSSFGDMQKTMKQNPVKFGDMFKDVGTEKWAESFAKNLENAMAGIDFGAMIGSQIGNITGGGQSAKSGGAIGGMVAGAGGANYLAGITGMGTGLSSLAISAGASLIGGLFNKGGNEQAKADKKSAEAKKAYDKNTDALNELSKNMANLNAGIDTLNSSLISSFSNIPTFGNLTDVTSTLEEMYTLMYTTRNFDSVAYQVTKTKKGKSGFMGIGAKAGSTWTETYEKDIQEMLDIYGYKGTIYDMTTEEMRSFAEWLDEYDMGDTDNFSVMADALEEYAEALEKFDKNIDKFFYDATMEGFVGISSSQQEALRQQIEDFYKNLGIVIDEEISAEIDKLAEQMSVMVTIMADVRGDFIDIWMNTGEEAGTAFVKSMSSYMEALMNNMAQVFFDVYLSDVTKGLSDEFKLMSEELVELKKQGSDLKWEDVTDSLSDNFAKVLEYISSAKEQTDSFNDVILELQKQALEAGFTISELIDMGIATGTQKTVVDSFEQALLSDDEAFISIGKMVGDMVGEAMAKSMIDNLMTEQVLAFSNQLDEVLNGSMSFDSLTNLAGEALSIGMMMEAERKRLEAITDMFNMGDVTYENQESNIKYDSGTSQSVQYFYTISSEVNAGNVIESDSVERLADELLDQIIEKLKVDKGIDITKNY